MVRNPKLSRFTLPDLPLGTYTVQAALAGFQTVMRKDLTLTVGSQTFVDFSLPVGQVQETVTVTGESPIVDTTSAAVATRIEQKQIAELPLNGRNFAQLVTLSPGVTSISFAGFILFAVGGTIFSGLEFALGDVATKVPDGVVQTLSVMESDLFAPVAAGAILALFATGIASLRYGVLPAWLAWLGFVIGVVTFTPAGFFGFLAFLVWVLITSVMLYTSQDQEAAAG